MTNEEYLRQRADDAYRLELARQRDAEVKRQKEYEEGQFMRQIQERAARTS